MTSRPPPVSTSIRHRRSALRLNPVVRRWLLATDAQQEAESPEQDWGPWLLQRLRPDRVVNVGAVLVDRALLTTHFACVPERCAPGLRAPGAVSCCADVEVSLSRQESARLQAARRSLAGMAAPGRPGSATRAAHAEVLKRLRHQGGQPTLCQIAGRCAFSRLDSTGRIRCVLRPLAKRLGVEQSALQPLSCRLFPLVLVPVSRTTVLLTVLQRANARLLGARPVGRYPCLADASLPLLVESLRVDLDWLFGLGFSRVLRRLVAAEQDQP